MQSKVGLRWGANTPQGSDAARALLVDAAEGCFREFGFANTTVDTVARRANVSRATVYRYFDGRDELVVEVVLRTADRYLRRLRPEIDELTSLAEVVVEWVVRVERATRRDSMLSLLWQPDMEISSAAMMVAASAGLFERMMDFFAPYFQRFAGELRQGVDLPGVTEWILRILVSFLTVEGVNRRSRDGQRAYLRLYMVPAICSAT
jgi:AcrR family transcriptional regulator